MAISIYSNVNVSILGVGNDTVDVSTVGAINSRETIIDGGFINQQNDYLFSGKVDINKRTKIASIKITAESGYYFKSKPNIITEFPENVSIKSIVSEREDTTNYKSRIKAYTVLLYYINSKQVFSGKRITCDIEYTTRKHEVSNTLTINNITFGNINVSQNGEIRNIKIYGTPGASFGVAVNEDEVIGVDDFGKFIINKHNSTSILSKKNQTTSYNYGKEIPVLTGKIGKNGYFSFLQKFPSNIIHHARLTAATTGGKTDVNINSNSGVKIGDRMYASQLSRGTVRKVTAVNTNGTQVTVDTSTTLADNSDVMFKRRRVYSIDIIPELTDELSSNIPSRDPEYRLSQTLDSTITLRASTASSNININSGGGGVDYDLVYSGVPSRNNYSSNKWVKVTLSIATQDSKIFTAATKTPRFSRVNPGASDWSIKSIITDATAFSGSDGDVVNERSRNLNFEINNIKRTISDDTNTCTITYNFKINKFGANDTIIDLDLDSILTTATP